MRNNGFAIMVLIVAPVASLGQTTLFGDIGITAIPGRYELVASHTRKCLDVPAGSLDDGIPVVQWTCNGGDNQTWRLETASDGYSRLIAQHSRQCLDVSGASLEDGAEIIQWQCHDGENQQWRIEAVIGGYQLVARHSGKCLDVRDESTNDGGSLIQWSCHGGANQTWLLRPSTSPPTPPDFPPLSGPSRIFTFDQELSYPVRDYTKHSRFVLYDNGAFVLQYVGAEYRGKYTQTNDVIDFEWEGWSAAGPWGATGTINGDLLTVRYNLIMQLTDFEDAVYALIR